MNGQLPRGLMTKDGTPVKPTTRLPSLRTSDSLTSTPSSSTTTPNTSLPLGKHVTLASVAAAKTQVTPSTSLLTGNTKKTRGGATKRVFKPIIPAPAADGTPATGRATRSQSGTRSENHEPERKRDSSKGDGRGGGRGGRGAGRGGRGGARDAGKNFIQLESSVFTGIDAAAIQSRNKRSGGGGSGSASTAVKETVKVERGVTKQLKNLMKDDFIADSDNDSDDSDDGQKKHSKVRPIGWDSLFFDQEKADSPVDPPPAPSPDSLTPASVLTDGRMVLMQLPDSLIPLTDDQLLGSSEPGLMGRLRVYASGRVEFIEDSGGSEGMQVDGNIFSCLRVDDSVHTIAIKSEDGKETKIDLKTTTPDSCLKHGQHVMCLDTEELEAVSVGALHPADHLVIVPELTPDLR